MKAGDTAYLVESNRFVHEVEILRCNGELYIVCLKITVSDCTLKHITYFLRLGKLSKVLVRLQSIKFRKIHMIIGIETIGKRIELFKTAAIYR